MEGIAECSFDAADAAKKYGFHTVEFDVRSSKVKNLK